VNIDSVRAPLARVLADLGADVRIEVGPDEAGLTAFFLPDGGIHSTLLEPGSEAQLLVDVADLVQNDVNFWLTGAWGEALPRCPGHPHPMAARVLDEAAWWVCPATGDSVARVGELLPGRDSP